ncbi:MAG: heme exporter protein CcmD [Pseudomonadota bacterium]
MPDLGKYAFEVLGAYGVTLLAIAGLTLRSVLRDRKARRALLALERKHDDAL